MHRVRAEPVRDRDVDLQTDPAIVARYLEDAAHYPGGIAVGVVRPSTIEEVSSAVRRSSSVLAVGAQSSLTGGATPTGGVVLSTERLNSLSLHDDHVVVGAGVTLTTLQSALAEAGRWFPPVPTYLGATVGGVVSTNAAGAATFKYGSVRTWVRGLTVVLATGDVLRLRRGDVTASLDGAFVIDTSRGECHVTVPVLRLPDVPKCSAGYYAAPGMDLIDLFIGAEGTLGVVVQADLATAMRPAGVVWLLVAVEDESSAIQIAGDLRDHATLDVAAIEHIDRRSIELLFEDGVPERLGLPIARDTDTMLLVQIEIAEGVSDADWPDLVLDEVSAVLVRYRATDPLVALPSDTRRAQSFVELREAVPACVNRRIARLHASDPRVHKTAADVIVPFTHFGRMMQRCRALCREAQLDLAVWGHISDGNVHPNILPRDYTDVQKGGDVLVELARLVVELGGSPLAEHGVGRNPVKQRLLQLLHGPHGIEAMRNVKRQLDREWKLAPGVLFEG